MLQKICKCLVGFDVELKYINVLKSYSLLEYYTLYEVILFCLIFRIRFDKNFSLNADLNLRIVKIFRQLFFIHIWSITLIYFRNEEEELDVKYLEIYRSISNIRQELDRRYRPTGTRNNPVRTCKDLFYGHPHFKDGKKLSSII